MNEILVVVRILMMVLAFAVSTMGVILLTIEFKWAEIATLLLGAIVVGVATAYFMGWVLFTEPEWPEEDETEGEG